MDYLPHAKIIYNTIDQRKLKISSNSLMHQLKKIRCLLINICPDYIKEGEAHLGSRISLAPTCL